MVGARYFPDVERWENMLLCLAGPRKRSLICVRVLLYPAILCKGNEEVRCHAQGCWEKSTFNSSSMLRWLKTKGVIVDEVRDGLMQQMTHWSSKELHWWSRLIHRFNGRRGGGQTPSATIVQPQKIKVADDWVPTVTDHGARNKIEPWKERKELNNHFLWESLPGEAVSSFHPLFFSLALLLLRRKVNSGMNRLVRCYVNI